MTFSRFCHFILRTTVSSQLYFKILVVLEAVEFELVMHEQQTQGPGWEGQSVPRHFPLAATTVDFSKRRYPSITLYLGLVPKYGSYFGI